MDSKIVQLPLKVPKTSSFMRYNSWTVAMRRVANYDASVLAKCSKLIPNDWSGGE